MQYSMILKDNINICLDRTVQVQFNSQLVPREQKMMN